MLFGALAALDAVGHSVPVRPSGVSLPDDCLRYGSKVIYLFYGVLVLFSMQVGSICDAGYARRAWDACDGLGCGCVCLEQRVGLVCR